MVPEMNRKPMTLSIPGDLHADLKIAAARRGIKLQELSVAILRAGIAREPKPQKKAK